MIEPPPQSVRSGEAFVFGYGSLVHERALFDFLGPMGASAHKLRLARLIGFRRSWRVAADPGRAEAGDMRYRNEATDEEAFAFITFLDLRPLNGGAVNGVLFRVTQAILAKLDRREANYRRIEVTARIRPVPLGPVFTYVGRPEARQRFVGATRKGLSVVAQRYYDEVHDAFRMWGDPFYRRFLATTDRPAIPIRPLVRSDLPNARLTRRRQWTRAQ